MRGRWPDGPEYLDKLQGSTETKERLKAILDTLYGQARMQEACAQLDISETRFHQLREAAMQAAVTAIEPRPSGRPSRAASAQAEEIRVLQQRVRELEQALHESQVREEIALVLPQVREEIALVLPQLRRTDGAACATIAGGEKKTPPPPVKIRKSR